MPINYYNYSLYWMSIMTIISLPLSLILLFYFTESHSFFCHVHLLINSCLYSNCMALGQIVWNNWIQFTACCLFLEMMAYLLHSSTVGYPFIYSARAHTYMHVHTLSTFGNLSHWSTSQRFHLRIQGSRCGYYWTTTYSFILQ